MDRNNLYGWFQHFLFYPYKMQQECTHTRNNALAKIVHWQTISALIVCIFMLSGCDAAGPAATKPTPQPSVQANTLLQAAQDNSKFKEFTLPASPLNDGNMTAGPDGNLWFTETIQGQNSKIGRITPTGTFSDFSLISTNVIPTSIATGPDGNLWFTEGLQGQSGKIGRITPAGKISEFPLLSDNIAQAITAGPDNNLWFSEIGKIGRISPTGQIKEFPMASPSQSAIAITAGSDGNIWFTEAGKIARISPQGTINDFPLPDSQEFPSYITKGPDNNIWFTAIGSSNNQPDKIGSINAAGQVKEFTIPHSVIGGLVSGADGALWFTEQLIGGSATAITVTGKIGHLTPAGAFSEMVLNTHIPGSIARGTDGKIWFTETDLNGQDAQTFMAGQPSSKVIHMIGHFI